MGSPKAGIRLKHKDWVDSKHHCRPNTDVWGRKGKDKEEPSSSVFFCVSVSLSTLRCSTASFPGRGKSAGSVDLREDF